MFARNCDFATLAASAAFSAAMRSVSMERSFSWFASSSLARRTAFASRSAMAACAISMSPICAARARRSPAGGPAVSSADEC